jgi:GGDEF domain-containing protein
MWGVRCSTVRASRNPAIEARARNRRSVVRYIERHLIDSRTTGAPVWVLCLDLNGFKAVNDTYGHTSGTSCFQFGGEAVSITTSLGFTVNDADSTPDSLLKSADAQTYQQKGAARRDATRTF